jgi:hypothetical protein
LHEGEGEARDQLSPGSDAQERTKSNARDLRIVRNETLQDTWELATGLGSVCLKLAEVYLPFSLDQVSHPLFLVRYRAEVGFICSAFGQEYDGPFPASSNPALLTAMRIPNRLSVQSARLEIEV